jgi:hypothetical protein
VATGGNVHALEQHPGVIIRYGPDLTLEGELPVLGRPLADLLERVGERPARREVLRGTR